MQVSEESASTGEERQAMSEKDGERFSGNRVILGCLIYLFFAFGMCNISAVAMGLLPDYYGVPFSSIVTTSSISTVVSLVFMFFNGAIYRKLTPRGAMVMGSIACLCMGLVMFFVKDFWGLAVFMALTGLVGGACLHTATTAVAVRWYVKNLSSKIGLIILMGVVGVAVFQFTSGFGLVAFGVGPWFLAAGVVTCAATMFAALVLVRNSPEELGQKPYGYDPEAAAAASAATNGTGEPKGSATKQLFRNPVFWIVCIAIFFCFPASMFSGYTTAYLPQYGVDYTTASTCVSILCLLGGLMGFLGGKIIDKMGLRPFLAIVFIAAAAGCALYALFSVVQSPLLVVLMVICAGLAYPQMMLNSFIVTPLFGAELSTEANGKLGVFLSGGIAVLNIVCAAILANAGFVPIWIGFAVISVIVLVLFYVALGMAKRRAEGTGKNAGE